MTNFSLQMKVGQKLRTLIMENYESQEDFAYDYGADIRTISRYVNNGINKIDIIQDLADFFGITFVEFFE